MITISELSKSFGDNEVLKNIHLSFPKGSIHGIVGENGAGKTTLFRCMAGLETHSGKVTSEMAPFKNHLGWLPTEPFFFKRMTGLEYIRMLCKARNKGIDGLESKNVFDLPLDQYASTYSTGMKKKLALTAILLQDNDYFILDEPFNGVDIQSNIVLSEIILKLKELNKIVIVSSHIFSTLSEICDEIHLLKKGVEIRTVQESDFSDLEKEMKVDSIGNRIDLLDLK